MNRTPLVPFLLLLFVVHGVATAAAPTMAQVRETYDAGQYQPTLKSIAQCLALKGPAADGYDRYELLTLKGECLVRLKSLAYAADAFEDAHAAVPECRLQPIRADRRSHTHGQRIALDVIGGRVCVRLGHSLSSAGVPRRWSVGYPRTVKDDRQKARRLRRWDVA